MITNKLVMYGCVVQAVMERLLIVWTWYMLVEGAPPSQLCTHPPFLRLHACNKMDACPMDEAV